MWSFRTENARFYEEFKNSYTRLHAKLREAIDLDEKTKTSRDINGKLRAAELYKEARELIKKANNFNIMDIPENHRSEVRELREKMRGYDSSAQDRICSICNEVAKKNPSSSQPVASRYSQAKKEVENDENVGPRKIHTCSRGDRCGTQKKKEINTGSVNAKGTPLYINKIPTNKASNRTIVANPNEVATNRAKLLKGVDKNIGERLLDEILDNTGITLDDVSGCEGAKRALEEAVILPALNPGLFSGLRQPVKGILLFGPPGNGKTLIAKAIACESNQKFFNISASSLTSKWVGDSEKTIRGLFQIARNVQPSIIFIDEIDSILCERSEKDAEVSRRIKTEFLVQFDGATCSVDDRILVIGATNRPYELDDAVLRRFPKRIMLGLPDESARYELVMKTLRKHNMVSGLSDRDIRSIASQTRGFSNSDLVSLCKEAAMVPIRGIDKSRLASTDQSKLRSITKYDFEESLRVIRPSTSEKIMTKLNEFANNFGC